MSQPLTILEGHVLNRLKEIPDESIQCVITSPPYWGLRDYKIQKSTWADGWKGCLGLEPTPAMFLDHMVTVFAEVHRVLRGDGTLWLNMGDSYSSNAGGYAGGSGSRGKSSSPRIGKGTMGAVVQDRNRITNTGMRPKNLCGIPWRLAFALQDWGWNLRADIIWHKPNPMPESVRDRPTKSHEYIFLLSKSRKYYYDYKAIFEPVTGGSHARGSGINPKSNLPAGWATSDKYEGQCAGIPMRRGRAIVRTVGANSRMNVNRDVKHATRIKQNSSFSAAVTKLVDQRNKRSVWTVATFPYKEAHYATFPPELIRPCVLAGAPKGGVVLDCFAGSGTTLMVALQEDRRAIGIEMSPENVKMIERRCTPSELDRQYLLYREQQLDPLPLFIQDSK